MSCSSLIQMLSSSSSSNVLELDPDDGRASGLTALAFGGCTVMGKSFVALLGVAEPLGLGASAGAFAAAAFFFASRGWRWASTTAGMAALAMTMTMTTTMAIR